MIARAVDGQGQVVDVYVSARRMTVGAAAFFHRAIAAIDSAATYPPVLAAGC